MQRVLTAAVLLGSLTLAAAPASAVHFSFSTGNEVDLDGDRVRITPHDGVPMAEITPEGVLRIDGRTIAVEERERVLLVRYNVTLRTITQQAIDVGMAGASVGIKAATAALVALLTGGDEQQIKAKVEPQAEHLKARARSLCTQVKELKRVEDELAERLEAFRPYALIDKPDCHIED